ncbi:hypothetical protein AN1V17_14700 [Vallitalea sediminicola]
MTAITTINNSVEMLNKFNTTIENNISTFNTYKDKIEEGYKAIDKMKKGLKLSDKIKKSGKLKETMENPMKGIINKMSQLIGKKNKEAGSKTQVGKKDPTKKKKWFSGIPVGIDKATKYIKKFWETPIGKNIKLGITQDEKFSGMVNQIKEKWNNTWVNMGGRIATALQPVLEKVLGFLDSKEFIAMLDLIMVIIEKIIGGVMMLLDYLKPLMDMINSILGVVIENSHIVLAVLGAVALAIGAITLATTIHNAVMQIRIIKERILKAILEANPTMIIIKAIIILITAFIALIATMEPVRTAIANLTRGFFDFVEWGINGLIEGLASAAEGIIRFAGDGINTFLNIFVNPFIDGINLIISGLNLLGANISKLDHLKVDFSGAAETTGKFIRKGKVDLSGAKEAVAGAIENFSADALKDKLGLGKLESKVDGAGQLQNKVNGTGKSKDVGVQVNKINDDVDIADEDVKLMRDVAEREMIQNFVTLTPTVSMGDMTVNENADADRLLGKITEALVTEVTNSAQGVYA